MKRFVLDTSALMGFFENRPGAHITEELLKLAADGKRHLFMSAVNWGEIHYSVWHSRGPGVAYKILQDVAQLPIQVVAADQVLALAAAELRAQFKLPYIDCFAAALAAQCKATLLTSDSDFAKLPRRFPILWSR
jgi:predicted nucleic acid-binding protein